MVLDLVDRIVFSVVLLINITLKRKGMESDF